MFNSLEAITSAETQAFLHAKDVFLLIFKIDIEILEGDVLIRALKRPPNCNQNTNSGGGGGNSDVDVSYLFGPQASSGESELQSRGFRLVDSAKGNDSYNHWFRRRSNKCIMVVTEEGRFSDIVPSKTIECK